MAVFDLVLPGAAALTESENMDGIRVTRWRTYTEFNGDQDRFMSVYFPFTIPLFFGVGPVGTGLRVRLVSVFVTFYVERTIPTGVEVRRIRVYDKYSKIFNSTLVVGNINLHLPEYDNDAAFTRYDSKVLGKNFFELDPPVWVNSSINMEVAVGFNEGGVIRFTGAGVKLATL
jgi:hypothetical protein